MISIPTWNFALYSSNCNRSAEDDRKNEGALGKARGLINEDEPGKGEYHDKKGGTEEDEEGESDKKESKEEEEVERGEDEENENELGVGNSDSNNEENDGMFRFRMAITTTLRYLKGFRKSTRPEPSFIHLVVHSPVI